MTHRSLTKPLADDEVAAAWYRHGKAIRAFARNRLGDTDAANDIGQEVFLRASLQGGAFGELRDARAWLHAVARNCMADSLRKCKREEAARSALAVLEELDAAESQDLIALLVICLPTALGRLSADDAAVLQRCDIDGATLRKYAQDHGVSLSAAKSRLRRARLRLRGVMVEHCRVRLESGSSVADFSGQKRGS